MPDPRPDESRSDFVSRCIPVVLEDGTADDRDQAVAICSQMWRDRAKSLVMKITKVQRLQNGRIRWQARANTGEFDLLQERFDQKFFDDVIANFYRTKEELSKGNAPPDGMTEPILDISHYSIYLPESQRNLARAGWIDKMWRDGRVLFSQGYFDDTRLGQLAAKAASDRKPEDRRVSIVVYPDYSLVEAETGGRKVYRGGNGKAWMDSLAMTSTPCDPGAVMEVKSMTTLKEDAQKVLGDEGAEIVEELEAARAAKTLPDGALVKSDEESAQEEKAMNEEPEVKTEEETPVEETTPTPEPLTVEGLQAALDQILPGIANAIDERFEPLRTQVADLAGKTEQFEAQIKALVADETQKVKAALDSDDGNWFARMWGNSVQRSDAVKGEIKRPKQVEGSDFARRFGEPES